MALRFRRSIKLAPGLRWNISGSGSSWTIGPRGASVGIGKRGASFNLGLPGTGLSSRSQLTGASSTPRRTSNQPKSEVSMNCAVLDDGTLSFTDDRGTPIAEHLVEVAKKQNRELIQGLMQRKCDEINDQVEALAKLHHDTPDPKIFPRHIPNRFPKPRPADVYSKQVGWFEQFLPGRRRKIEESNAALFAEARQKLAEWEHEKIQFEKLDAARRVFLESDIYNEISAMESFLEENLGDIGWPRETTVAFEIAASGEFVAFDIDLPEIDDMPNKLAAIPARGLKLSVKEISATKVQKLYAEHIHGVLFRIVGEAFAALPNAKAIEAAGYSQRRDPSTAQLQDDYLLSVRVTRDEWLKIDFAHLSDLDVLEALNRFDLKREMTKTGMFKPITVHSGKS